MIQKLSILDHSELQQTTKKSQIKQDTDKVYENRPLFKGLVQTTVRFKPTNREWDLSYLEISPARTPDDDSND